MKTCVNKNESNVETVTFNIALIVILFSLLVFCTVFLPLCNFVKKSVKFSGQQKIKRWSKPSKRNQLLYDNSSLNSSQKGWSCGLLIEFLELQKTGTHLFFFLFFFFGLISHLFYYSA